MPSLRQDELFELDFDPGKAKAATGNPGEIGGQTFQQFARGFAGLSAENLAEGVVIDSLFQIVPGSSPREGGHGKDGGAKDGLGFSALGIGHTEMAGQFQINQGESGRHGVR